jgi:asparaginyl-tRNA synthetase
MIEPEIAFCDLDENMAIAEALLVRIVGDVIRECGRELDILDRDRAALERVQPGFPRISYTDAVELLRSAESRRLLDEEEQSLHDEKAALEDERGSNRDAYGSAGKGEKRRLDAREIEINARLERVDETLKNVPAWRASAEGFEWGGDFGGSDETVLTKHFDTPIIVHRFPHEVKAFYMKRDPADDRLALGMDVLAPEGYGEIVGGGERATDLEFLRRQIATHQLPESVFDWYLDLRRYGSVPHSGFGLGLERTIAWVCGLPHIREASPFPRLIGRLNP